MSFTPPTPDERKQAIGPLERLPPRLERAFTSAGHFDPLPPPGPHDWLANHPEPGQSFREWHKSDRVQPDERRQTIYLQPLESFTGGESPALDDLHTFTEAFFALPVQLLPPLIDTTATVTSRTNPYTGELQLLTTDLLRLLRLRLPADAFCILGITMRDLYPDPQWNFVFGQASLRARVGVYSFARYKPSFPGNAGSDAPGLVLRRSCKVLAHEAGHMFGIHHCIWYHCLLNGSNHLAESDARPLHLCPVDLRKLYVATGFDVVERYRRLATFWRSARIEAEAEWIERRVAYISGGER